MNIFTKIFTGSPRKASFSIALGAVTGLIYSLVIPLAISSLDDLKEYSVYSDIQPTNLLGLPVSNPRFAAVFFAMCVFIFFAKTLAEKILTDISLKAGSDLRQELYQRLTAAPISELDKIGANRIHTVLTDDVNRVTAAARLVPSIITSVVSLLCMVLYIGFLNTHALFVICKALALGAASYAFLLRFTYRSAIRPRADLDLLYDGIRGLIRGAKELKLSEVKRRLYLNSIMKNREEALRKSLSRSLSISAAVENYGDILSLLTIGYIAFVFTSQYLVTTDTIILIVMALLYITSPVAAIFNAASQFSSTRVSMSRINHIMKNTLIEKINSKHIEARNWNSIYISDLYFSYDVSGGYSIGPITLELKKGEIVFVIGGNGSGKSTLGKILSLHYIPTAGRYSFDDNIVSEENRDIFRKDVAAIFPDYHLFNDVPAVDAPIAHHLIDSLLDDFGLKPKVQIKSDGTFSTLDLSDGQKKRLALVVALAENKELYIFDEWAAEQDPDFREYFYVEILARLRKQNKAIVVISHDDRYFGLADRVFKMKAGILNEI